MVGSSRAVAEKGVRPLFPGGGIHPRLLTTMAIASGVAVANIYYIQPLVAEIGRTLHASPSAMGLVITLGQLGFATGMLLFVPLGDIRDRRLLIVVMLAGAAASLAGVAVAPSYAWLAISIFFVGAFSVTPQMFVPFAAHLAAPHRRGHAVGVVMSGLLVGILASRAASGSIGAAFGWRSVYWIAAGTTSTLAIGMGASLPRLAAGDRISYARLLRSLWELVRSEPVLREASLAGATFFGSFTAFWSMLAFRLELPPLHYGSEIAGLLSLVGIAGALAAPVAGRVADRINPRTSVQVALLVTALAFVVFAVWGDTLTGLVTGIVVLDVAVQAGHVTNLSRIHGLSAEARNRLTTVYMVAFFLGGAVGSALTAYAWERWHWIGVCMVGAAMRLLAVIVTETASRRSTAEHAEPAADFD